MLKEISVKKIVVMMMLINIFSKGFGFVRELLLAALYGTSPETDAYYIAISVPLILLGFVKSFSIVYTPIYVELSENNEKSARMYTKKIMQIIISITLVIIILAEMFMPQLLRIFAPGYGGKTFQLTLMFSRIAVILGLTSALIELLSANLRCNNHFMSQAIAGLVLSPIECIMIILGNFYQKWLLILGPVIGEIVQLALVIIFFLKYDKDYKIDSKERVDVKKQIGESFVLIVPVFLGSMISQVNTFFDSMFASMLESGSVTSLNYAGKIYSMTFTLIFSTISGTLFPLLSRIALDEDSGRLKNKFEEIVNYLIVIAVPITIYSVFCRKDIVAFIYERGSFSTEMSLLTAASFAAYMSGIAALGIQEVSNKLFYSLKKTKYSLIVSGVNVLLNVFCNAILIRVWGQTGLALASSLSVWITMPLIYILIKRVVGKITMKAIVLNLLKSVIACMTGVMTAVFIYKIAGVESIFFRLVIISFTGMSSYLLLMYLMKSNEVINIANMFIGKVKRK